MKNEQLNQIVSNMLYGSFLSDGTMLTHSSSSHQSWGMYRDYLRKVHKRKTKGCYCKHSHMSCALVDNGVCSQDIIKHLVKHGEAGPIAEIVRVQQDLLTKPSDDIFAAISTIRKHWTGANVPMPIQIAVDRLKTSADQVAQMERDLEETLNDMKEMGRQLGSIAH